MEVVLGSERLAHPPSPPHTCYMVGNFCHGSTFAFFHYGPNLLIIISRPHGFSVIEFITIIGNFVY